MIIDDNYRAAIRALVENLGGAARLAEQCALSRPTAYHIASDKCKIIQAVNWKKLEPHLRPFLEKQKQPVIASDGTIRSALLAEITKLDHEQLEQAYRYCIKLQVKE